MPDLDQLLTPEVGDAAAQAVRFPEFAVIERRAAQRRRSRTALTLSAAAVAVGLAVAGSLQVAGRDGASPTLPAHPTPTPTAAPLVNGRLQSLQDYLAGVHPSCGRCDDENESAFDLGTGRVLLSSYDAETGGLTALRVVGPRGELARLTCPHDFSCRTEPGPGRPNAVLGPGPDEITLTGEDQQQIQVVTFAGTARHAFDLSAVLADKETVQDLSWSPDRRRLAVETRGFARGAGMVHHLWLVDRYGGGIDLAYTARYPGQPPKGKIGLAYVGSLTWSPDSSRLAFIEEHAHLGGSETSVSTRAMSLLLPPHGQDGPSRVSTIYEYAGRLVDISPAVVWSPDGTRVAVRLEHAVLELPADGGSVLAQHPGIGGVLLWPAQPPR